MQNLSVQVFWEVTRALQCGGYDVNTVNANLKIVFVFRSFLAISSFLYIYSLYAPYINDLPITLGTFTHCNCQGSSFFILNYVLSNFMMEIKIFLIKWLTSPAKANFITSILYNIHIIK